MPLSSLRHFHIAGIIHVVYLCHLQVISMNDPRAENEGTRRIEDLLSEADHSLDHTVQDSPKPRILFAAACRYEYSFDLEEGTNAREQSRREIFERKNRLPLIGPSFHHLRVVCVVSENAKDK